MVVKVVMYLKPFLSIQKIAAPQFYSAAPDAKTKLTETTRRVASQCACTFFESTLLSRRSFIYIE